MHTAAPTGLVSFLFTDIEGSTVRWEAHREAMQLALRRHDGIVRAAIEGHGGHVFKTIGDAFCAAFSSTGQAVAAALEAQRRIGAEDWEEVRGVRVRMAVHAGEADERSGDYFGPVVNRVARLLAAGHGGQVLLSGYAAELAASSLPDGVTLRHLGMLPLKDLKEPERVHQLCAPDLPQEFKPLRALETPPNNLPRQHTSFVGREQDLTAVKELLRRNALVTIVGVGGMGKTRLALQAASDLLNDTSEGAWFVDLARIAEPALVASTILSALGADQSGEAPGPERVVEHLKKHSLLLVLDNCEHLLDEVARIAAAVAARCPGVTILATSREPLGVSGERAHRLASLEPAAATRLFIERAMAAQPRFEATGAARKIVEDVCRRLDGIALAIELAAARVRTISLDDLSRKLELRILSGGGRDRDARQQTMRALVDWSYDLLSDEDKRAFRATAAFSGGFTLEAAGAVFEAQRLDEFETIDRLASLADKSLLVVSEDRYRLLEPIREYAIERLQQSGELESAYRAHAEYFAGLADRAYEEFDTSPPPDWVERNERELDNYRVALKFALVEEDDVELGGRVAGGAGTVFMRLTQLSEGLAWCELALFQDEPLTAAVEARLRYVASMLYNNQLRQTEALSSALRAAELYRDVGDDRGLTRALSQVGQQYAKLDDFERAIAAAEEALRIANSLGDSTLLAGVMARSAGSFGPSQIDCARKRYAESVNLFRELGRKDDEARVLCGWIGAEGLAGAFEEAAAVIERALPLAVGELRMWIFQFAMTTYWMLGDRKRADPATRETIRLAACVGHPTLLASAMSYAAIIASDSDVADAARLLGYADSRHEASGYIAEPEEGRILDGLRSELVDRLGSKTVEELFAQGRAWSDDHAITVASRV